LPIERLSLAENLVAALKSGTLAFADVAPTLEWLAQDENGDVAARYVEVLTWAWDDALDAKLKPKLAQYARKLYAARFKKLGWKPAAGEPPSARHLRNALVQFLALTLRDPETLKAAAQLGKAYAGTDGKFHPEAVSADLAGVVLASAVAQEPALQGQLIERLGTLNDGEMRMRVIGAVGASTDAKASEQANALWKDKRLRASELAWPYYVMLESGTTREKAWTSFQADYDALMPKLEPMFRGGIPKAASGFCDAEHARQIEALFGARLEKFPETRRSLEGALEQVRNCASLVASQKASVATFFEKAK
jgi:hypothetical protein